MSTQLTIMSGGSGAATMERAAGTEGPPVSAAAKMGVRKGGGGAGNQAVRGEKG